MPQGIIDPDVAGRYGLPQGIEVGASGEPAQAVPRKIGAYDTEGQDTAVANFLSPLVFFQNAAAFTATGLLLTKQYGRDTNITSRTGGMAKGERLYAYGLTAKVFFVVTSASDWNIAANQLDASANVVQLGHFRGYWERCDMNIKLGSDEFVRTQARDIPLQAPRPSGTSLLGGQQQLWDLNSEGMYDLTVADSPYVLDQQEDFRIELTCATALSTTAFAMESYITFRIEGVRLKAVRR